MNPRALFLTILLLPHLLSAAPASVETDRAALLAGVGEITADGAPGPLCVFGPEAFPIVAGRGSKSALLPVAAAARWEKGRVVAFGHGGFLSAVKESGDSGRMLLNAVRWAAGEVAANAKVGVLRNRELAGFLQSSGIEAELLEGDRWSARLDAFRVLVADSHLLGAEAESTAVARHVRAGGGLITAGLGWGWQQLNPKKELVADHPGNRLLAPAGIVWGDGTIEKTGAAGYRAEPGDLALLNASVALDALLAHAAQKAPLTPARLAQTSATLSAAMRSIPPGDTLLLPRFAALAALPGADEFPQPAKPLTSKDPLARLMWTRTLQLLNQAKPEQLRPHPAAEFFPGAVPAGAPRLQDRTVEIATGTPGWHSTGLYAAPGEPIRVQVPPGAAGRGLGLRIGCHSDALWHLEAWKRSPEISRTDKIEAPALTVANAFGGLIYLTVPEGCALGAITATVSGAVEAPRFVLGKTSLADWRARSRQAPAPWAELETSKVILTIPAKDIRALDDPETLLRFWDAVLDAEADLAAIPHERPRPERIVADVEISAGYMHSGYPIMTHLDVSDRMVSVDKLKSGGWGFWHELGHNHQQGDWTFDGTTEVTCNLFSLYVCETLCGQPPGLGHEAMEPGKASERFQKHLAGGASFERWKSDPFLALTMYRQLRQGFGWETYKQLFAEYRALPKSERPKTDDEKRDQWLVRFSHATGKNLGLFFQEWGVPTSEAARASIADLTAWLPADWPQN